MARKTVNDYNTVVRTKNVEERDTLITELYHSGVEYFYTDKDKEGFYTVAYNK